VPVYELLGGPCQDKIRVYWGHCGLYRTRIANLMKIPQVKTMDDVYDLGKEVVKRGFHGFEDEYYAGRRTGPDTPEG